MSKQATIKCPHCGKPITVRQADDSLPHVDTSPIWKAVDKAVDDAFKKVFGK